MELVHIFSFKPSLPETSNMVTTNTILHIKNKISHRFFWPSLHSSQTSQVLIFRNQIINHLLSFFSYNFKKLCLSQILRQLLSSMLLK